ncbi:MAG: hypothetical protein K2X60_03520 [Xanthobacteraceae bacterium]|nr:hypothetical protein [Xanthobacteraceae bacterium]
MNPREAAFLRHQQERWLRPDAYRWVRSDAVRYLKPGSDLTSALPALDRKYSPSQPRVPAGSGRESGRWTDGSSGGDGAPGSIAQPMGNIDFGDLPNFSDLFALFQIAPGDFDLNGVQLAGDPPPGDSPELPSNDPPEIPTERPSTGSERMGFVRAAAQWIGLVGRYSPVVSTYFEALDQIEQIKALTDVIKSSNDPPKNLEELQALVGSASQPGYHDHHIVEEKAAQNAGIPESFIQGRDNLARIPTLKHYDITADYQRTELQPDGSFRSLREFLQDKDFETRRAYGLAIMRKNGVLK